MNRKEKRLPRRSTAKRLQFERLEERRVFYSYIEEKNLFATHDGFVVLQDSQSNDLRLLDNDRNWSSSVIDLAASSVERPSEFNGPPRIAELSTPENGLVVISEDGNTAHYTPTSGFVGVDHFQYTLVNSKGQTSSADVYVNVVAPFVAIDDWFRVDLASDANSLALLSNDRKNAAAFALPGLTIVQVGSTENGVITIAENGTSVTYRPATGFAGLDEFTYVARDPAGHESTAKVRVRVTESEDNDSLTWPEQRRQILLEKSLSQNNWQFGTPIVANSWNYGYFIAEDAVALARTASNSVSGGGVASTTNTQVVGVDEGDIVKADGEYLYVLSNRTEEGQAYQQLIVIDTQVPTEPFVVSRIDFRGRVLEEYLFEDRLFVVSTDGFLHEAAANAGYDEDFAVTVFDLSDHAQPQVLHETFVEGSFMDSRASGDYVYVVSSKSSVDSELPHVESHCVADGDVCFSETVAAFIERTRDGIEELASRNDSPHFISYGPDGTVSRSGVVSDQPRIEFAATESGEMTSSSLTATIGVSFMSLYRPQFQIVPTTSITAFHGRGATVGPTSGVSIAQHVSPLYASPESMYLVGDYCGYCAATASPGTPIHKFTISTDGIVDWVAKGTVAGQVQNQFSMDEHNGFLRVIVGGWGFAGNRLQILEQQGDKLSVVGQIENIAPGEQIYSARFMGDRGFVVTFRIVDPLFAMDLSDPHNPQILGELKIPGNSQYLHFMDDTHLLGIGRNASEQTGQFQEMQVSLFDITDLSDPNLRHRYSFEGARNTWSPILADAWRLGDHHSFSYFPEHQVLAIPLYSGNGDGWSWAHPGSETNNSIRLFKIDPEAGIDPLGEIDFDVQFDPSAARSVRIGDSLYAISPDQIKVVDLVDPSQQHAILFIGLGATDDHSATRANAALAIDVTTNDDFGKSAKVAKIASLGKTSRGGLLSLDDEDQTIIYSPPPDFVGTDTFTYMMEMEGGYRSQALVSVDVKPTWHNMALTHDANGDGFITPLDVLIEINFMNRHRGGSINDLERRINDLSTEGESRYGKHHLDVDNDQFISPLDVLSIINKLKDLSRQRASAESQSPPSTVAVDAVFADPQGPIPWLPLEADDLVDAIEF